MGNRVQSQTLGGNPTVERTFHAESGSCLLQFLTSTLSPLTRQQAIAKIYVVVAMAILGYAAWLSACLLTPRRALRRKGRLSNVYPHMHSMTKVSRMPRAMSERHSRSTGQNNFTKVHALGGGTVRRRSFPLFHHFRATHTTPFLASIAELIHLPPLRAPSHRI